MSGHVNFAQPQSRPPVRQRQPVAFTFHRPSAITASAGGAVSGDSASYDPVNNSIVASAAMSRRLPRRGPGTPSSRRFKNSGEHRRQRPWPAVNRRIGLTLTIATGARRGQRPRHDRRWYAGIRRKASSCSAGVATIDTVLAGTAASPLPAPPPPPPYSAQRQPRLDGGHFGSSILNSARLTSATVRMSHVIAGTVHWRVAPVNPVALNAAFVRSRHSNPDLHRPGHADQPAWPRKTFATH